MNKCSRLLSDNTLQDLEEAVSVLPDEKGVSSSSSAMTPCHGRRCRWISIMGLVVLVFFTASHAHLFKTEFKQVTHPSSSTFHKTNPETKASKTETVHRIGDNLDFPSENFHTHADPIDPEKAYAILFSPQKNNSSKQPASKETDEKNKKTRNDILNSYSLDNSYIGLPAGQACRNHFDCANRACGLKRWTSEATLVCCVSGFTLFTTLPDWTLGHVCGQQVDGDPCQDDNMCALGRCQNNVCQSIESNE